MRAIALGRLMAILCLMCACRNLPEAHVPNGVHPGSRIAVFDTLYIYPDSASLDYRCVIQDTLWHDSTTTLSNGTQVMISLRWVAGVADTIMRYTRVDSGAREYSIVRNDTLFHETALYLPGVRIDTLLFMNAELQVRAKYGNTEKMMTVNRRDMYIQTRRMNPGTLLTVDLPEFKTTWNNRWLVLTLNLNGSHGQSPIFAMLCADLNTGKLSIQRQYTHITSTSLVPVTDATGAWLHTGLAVWADLSHPFPIPNSMAMYGPDACWTTDTSYILVVPAPIPYAAYFSYENGRWTLTDSILCPIPEPQRISLCPDYNNDLLWLHSTSDSLLGIGFQTSAPPQWIPLKEVSVPDWNSLMLPVIVFHDLDDMFRIRLDIRGKIAYFVSDT